MGWIAEVYRERGPALTVQDVVQAAGVGRNTFYEYFDGLEHALDYAAQTHAKAIHERISAAVEAARTPIAKLRELSRAWFAEVELDPARSALLLRVRSGARSTGTDVFASLLDAALKQGRSQGIANADVLLVDYAAFAGEGGARSLLSGAGPLPDLQESLATLLTRLFR